MSIADTHEPAPVPNDRPAVWALVIADMHVPYHDKRAVEVMLKHADGNCDGVLILGDLIDAHAAKARLGDQFCGGDHGKRIGLYGEC